MFLKRYTFYLLFSLAYTLALIGEKPDFSANGSWLSFLPTGLVHFSLFALFILVNNALLIPRTVEKKRFGLYVTGLIILMASFTFFSSWYNAYIHGVLFHDKSIGQGTGLGNNLMLAFCVLVIAAMLYITQKWSDQRVQVKNIQISHLQTELKYLRSQINPHFLFNGLNTIYGTIDMNNTRARDMMVQFSDLLRYNLYEADVDMIELEKEVKYLQNYVALQKARSNDNMQVCLKVNYQNGAVKIAPLIFMAFVENTFKYASRGDHVVNIINIGLIEEAGRIDFTCDNSYDEVEPGPGGIGLNNAVRRLELLYKDRYRLDIKKEPNIFHVHLTLTV